MFNIKLQNLIILTVISYVICANAVMPYAYADDSQTLNYQLQKKKNNSKSLTLDVYPAYKSSPRIEEDLDAKVNGSDHFCPSKVDKNLAITLKNDRVNSKVPSSANLAQHDQLKRSRAFKEVTVPLNGSQSRKNLNIGLNLDLATE